LFGRLVVRVLSYFYLHVIVVALQPVELTVVSTNEAASLDLLLFGSAQDTVIRLYDI